MALANHRACATAVDTSVIMPGMTVALSEAWIGIIGALGGVAITGQIGLVTAVLNHRWTRQSAEEGRRNELLSKLAELRRDAYARYLVAAQVLGEELDVWEPPDRSRPDDGLTAEFRRAKTKVVTEYDASLRHARLLATEPVVRALATYNSWMADQITEAVRAWQQRSDAAPFADWDAVEGALVDTMRGEQGAALADQAATADSP